MLDDMHLASPSHQTRGNKPAELGNRKTAIAPERGKCYTPSFVKLRSGTVPINMSMEIGHRRMGNTNADS